MQDEEGMRGEVYGCEERRVRGKEEVRALTHPKVTTNAKQREMPKAMPAVRPCHGAKRRKKS